MAYAYLLQFAEEERKRSLLRVERRRLRDYSNPLELPEVDFVANFRVTKGAFQQILLEISDFLPAPKRKTAIRNELKILAALNFYANGSYQKNVGASFLFNMSQPTFSKCLHEVTNALNEASILKKYIRFPFLHSERAVIMEDFMEKFRIPGTIGCIDGTQVGIVKPTDHEEAFYNRKNFHSLNVLIICDTNLNIIHVDASHGGASHDSYVWNASPVKSFLENLRQNGELCWLLGDSGYAQRPWLMTPILGARPGSPEEHYTMLHCRARNTVERCIGVLKARWRCLLRHRTLHYDPKMCAKIVNACVVLHNIVNGLHMPLPELLEETNQNINNENIPVGDPINSVTRGMLVNRLWNGRSNF